MVEEEKSAKNKALTAKKHRYLVTVVDLPLYKGPHYFSIHIRYPFTMLLKQSLKFMLASDLTRTQHLLRSVAYASVLYINQAHTTARDVLTRRVSPFTGVMMSV